MMLTSSCINNPLELGNAQLVALDKDALTIKYASGDSAGCVTRSVGLPSRGANGSSIVWISNSSRITIEGIVTLRSYGSGDTSVVLTATISKGIDSSVKDFVLTVKDSSESHYELLKREYIRLAGTLQHEVELFRGKPFKRPVTTAVYTLAQYKNIITQTTNTYTPAEKKRYNDIFKAEGLIHRDADYFAGQDSMYANETGGFYKEGSDSIYLILDDTIIDLSYNDSITLFHELIHAEQDQYIGLTTLGNSVSTSDRSYGLQYVLEGEAELLSIYYYYKMFYGSYPSSSGPIMSYFDEVAVWANNELDSMHNAGEPLLLKQPFYWAYYSYGPRFINGVVGMNWSLIDANIYPRLPIKTCVAIHPAGFPTEYHLDFDTVVSFIDTTFLYDVDELGEVLMNVLFREWDFPDYLQLAEGLLADNMVAYRTQMSDSVRTGWYTYWQDAAKSATFFTKITSLINMKRNITLPSATQSGDTAVVYDAMNKVYIESNAGYVFILENYQSGQLQELITRMRGVKWYVNGSLAKSIVSSRRYPFVDKSKLAKGWMRQLDGAPSPVGVRN